MASEKAPSDMLRVPAFNVEVREKSYFFSLPNSSKRFHSGKAAANYNVDTQVLRVARWAIEKNTDTWGLRIEEDNTVSAIYPDTTEDADIPFPAQQNKSVVELVDRIILDLKTLRSLLS